MLGTLSVLSQKGGSGKTTLGVALAVAHERAGKQATVIDLDPQGTAGTWGRLRGGTPPAVIATQPSRLAWAIETARKDGADLIVIDGPPREGGGSAAAAQVADLVLVPCRPATPDLTAIPATLAVVADTTRTAVVLNACPSFGSWTTEAAEAVVVLGAELCPVTLGHRIAHARAFTSGRTAEETEPRSRAAAEIAALYRWMIQEAT